MRAEEEAEVRAKGMTIFAMPNHAGAPLRELGPDDREPLNALVWQDAPGAPPGTPAMIPVDLRNGTPQTPQKARFTTPPSTLSAAPVIADAGGLAR